MKHPYFKTILLCLCMFASINAFAEAVEIDGIYYNLVTKAKQAEVTSNPNKYRGSIIIPESVSYNGVTCSVKSIGSYAFEDCSGLTSVTIGNSVTSIESSAFRLCSGLTSVTIPNSVTSIGESAFGGSGLTSVTIGNSVTSIGSSAFSGCTRLTSVTIPNSVTSIGSGAFKNCSGLTSVTIGNSVTSIGYHAFYKCSSLTSVTIGNSVTSLGSYAFYNCGSLTSVTIPNSVKSIEYGAFYDCSGLTSVTIGNSVTSIGKEAFYNCGSLTSVTIPNSVTRIGESAFYDCSRLTSVTIGNSVTSIGESAFYDCSGLKKVIVPDIAAWCGITFGSNPLTYAKHLYRDETTEITNLIIPNSVTSIGDGAFRGCSGLTSVTIPNSVTSIGESAFYDCSGLTSVTIGNSVTSTGKYAFRGCTSLTSVTIPNSVTSIGEGAFCLCSGLTSVNIPNSVTSIGESAFYKCSGLTSVTIGNGVKIIESEAFYDCSGLKKVIVPDIAAWCGIAFYDIDSNPLYYAKHLYSDETTEITNLIIPSSVTSIGEKAFYSCSGLTSVTIPNSVTSIRYNAFYKCSGLTSVTIGNGVKIIEYYAFADCAELTDVYCYAESVPSTYNDVFADSYTEYATLHVPAASVGQYKTTAPWSTFGTIVATDGTIPEPPTPPTPPTPEKCATPTISYSKGELTFSCNTEGAEFISEIKDADIKKHYTASVSLTATYNISVYATKADCENSDTIQATLCWIEQQPQTEGITDEDAVAEVQAVPVLIQTQGNTITVEGAEAGTEIILYGTNGVQLDSVIATTGTASLNASGLSGSVAIVKIGNKTVKVLIKQ